MIGYRPSIRHKIQFGYYSGVIIIVGLVVLTLIELRYMEKKIMFGEIISELFDTTLEIRRFEKNFFLYRQDEDLKEATGYVARSLDILSENREEYGTLAVSQQLRTLERSLQDYDGLLKSVAAADRKNTGQLTAMEGRIREKGKEITTIAEEVRKIERERLRSTLVSTEWNLILSILFFSLAGIIIGQVISRTVVRPLKALEASMKRIADGKFETVPTPSKDIEIVSLADAFNKMLMELELRQRHIVQSEKLASLGTLLSGVAHELNNPLSNISSSCQILAEEIEEPALEYKKELIAQIDEQTDRARNIVRSLLEFSRSREFKKEELELRKVMEETIQFIRGQIPTGVTVTVDIPEKLTLTGDKQRLQQAFLNLFKNSIEAIEGDGRITIAAVDVPGGEIREFENSISLECRNILPPGAPRDSVFIRISDTGTGIGPEHLGKIFDPFYTTKDVGKGSGLGLAIVHEIVEEHDGCIGAASEAGKGTTFLIRFPVARPQ
ncbi:MAG TPA: HAMP domain-containing sensor histidine kinase [Dissulfurispiraceae bacterium]|nr:HAMP domain-containing sensor histidine kinase [Dissulfurispiraceae bacterium]